MAAKKVDSSGISFTAFYTGEVWRRHDLSVPFLATPQGRIFYTLGQPVETVARWLLGGNNITLLMQRHLILDHLLEKAILEEGFTQVVEIACGLSPRGTLFSKRFAGSGIRYIEADLPGMAARKRKLLADAGELNAYHQVVDLDILTEGGADSLEAVFSQALDPDKKTLVITEGLINYFDLSVIQGFWQRLATLLKRFPEGRYLTDLYMDLQWHRSVKVAKALRSALAVATRSSVNLHFHHEQALKDCFQQSGFSQTIVHLPESYYGVLDIPVMRTPSLVRVVENRV